MAACDSFGWTNEQILEINKQLQFPTMPTPLIRLWEPKYPLSPPPHPDMEENWSAKDFLARGFPFNPLPSSPPATLRPDVWDSLVEEGVAMGHILPSMRHQLDQIKSWLIDGVPNTLAGPALQPTSTKHIFNSGELPIAIDSIATFVAAKHMAGPFDEWTPAVKSIGIFGRWKRLVNSQRISTNISHISFEPVLRIIYNLSAPRGRSTNDAYPAGFSETVSLKLDSLEDFLHILLRLGPGSLISRHDIKEAYKVVPLHSTMWPYFTVKINGCTFVNLKLCYGDGTACHFFSSFHERVQRDLIIPRTSFPEHDWLMVVDDSIALATPSNRESLREYDAAYTKTMHDLGFTTKAASPDPYKAYREATTGEVLGYVFNTIQMTWTMSPKKINAFLEVVDKCIDPNDRFKVWAVPLKTAQKLLGKVISLSCPYKKARRLAPFINLDVAEAVRCFPGQQFVPLEKQLKVVVFSAQAREDIRLIRAFVASLEKVPCKISRPHLIPHSSVQTVIYTDASGRVYDESGQEAEEPPGLGAYIPPGTHATPVAAYFALPMNFLLGQDKKRPNYHHSTLLEMMAVLAVISHQAELLRNQNVLVITDSSALVSIYQSGLPSSGYTAHTLRALNNTCENWNISLNIAWRRRRSDSGSCIADDLTHNSFKLVPDYVQNRISSTLPGPLASVLSESASYHANVFHQLYSRLVKYWEARASNLDA